MKVDRRIGDGGVEPAATQTFSEVAPLPTSPPPTTEDSSSSYEVEGEHARGGLGRVLRAWDRRLNRPVAVKELLHRRPEHATRFRREVEITARLQHPNIVPVYEAGRWPNGTPFYAMKFVSGRTLRQLIEERPGMDERLALLPSVLAVADAIAYAHSEGIIHRDLKPSNVLVGSFGETVVVDWGLAKDTRERADLSHRDGGPYRVLAADETQAGTVLGTPSYMPPEQAAGGEVDAFADVYAMGAILYSLLAGRAPYSGETSAAIVDRVIAGPPAALESLEPGVPPDLAAIVKKAMARRPTDRYASARALADDLRRFQTGQLVGAHHYSRSTLAVRWLRQRRSAVAVAVVLIAVLAASLTITIRRIVRERDNARAERAVAQQRSNELVLTQAETSLATDPARALSWLKSYPDGAPDQARAQAIAADAVSRGVARAIFKTDHNAVYAALSPDGRTLVGGGEAEALDVWSLPSGRKRQIPFATTLARLRFSADGTRLVAVGEYGRLAVWDTADWSHRDLVGHHARIEEALLSADGQTLLSRDSSNAVCVWTLPSGTRRCRALRPGAALEVTFGRSGEPIVLLASGGVVELSNAMTGKPIGRLNHGAGVLQIASLPRAAIVLTVSQYRVRAWSADDQRLIDEYPTRAVPADIALSPDGRFASHWYSDDDRSIVVRDLIAKTTRVLRLSQGTYATAFSPSGDRFAAGGTGGLVTVFDLDSMTAREFVGHAGLISHVEFSADGTSLISTGTEDRTVRVWPLGRKATRVLRGDGEGQVLQVRFSPAGDRVAAASTARDARVWSLRSVAVQPVTIRHADLVQSIDFSPDGRFFAAASWDGTASWRNLESGSGGDLRHAARVQRVQWIDDGATLATATMDGTIALWSLVTGARTTLGRHVGPVARLLLSPDKQTLLTAGDEDGTIRLWNIDARTSRIITRHTIGVDCAIYLGDGSRVVSAGLDGVVRVSDVASAATTTLRGKGSRLLALAASPDGDAIAAAGDDGAIYTWRLSTGTTRALRGHSGRIRNLAFSPDGRLLASAGFDHTVRVWDLSNGDAGVLRGHEGHVIAVAFSPDGKLLASAGSDSTVRLWPVDSIQLIPGNRNVFRRWLAEATSLTDEQ